MAEVAIVEMLMPLLEASKEQITIFLSTNPEILEKLTKFRDNVEHLSRIIKTEALNRYKEIGLSTSAAGVLIKFYKNHKKEKKIQELQNNLQSEQEKNQNALVGSTNTMINKIGKVEKQVKKVKENIKPFLNFREEFKLSLIHI